MKVDMQTERAESLRETHVLITLTIPDGVVRRVGAHAHLMESLRGWLDDVVERWDRETT